MIILYFRKETAMFFQRLLNDDPIQALPVVIAAALIYWFVRRSKHKKKFADSFTEVRKRSRFNEIVRLLFICFIVELICCTLFPTAFWYKLWHYPFERDFYFYMRFQRWELAPKLLANIWLDGQVLGHSRYIWLSTFWDFAVNIVLYIPLGLFLPLIWKRAKLWKVVLIGFGCTFLIEFLQAFIGRQGSADDVICNTLGALASYTLYLLMKKLFPRFTEKCKTVAE